MGCSRLDTLWIAREIFFHNETLLRCITLRSREGCPVHHLRYPGSTLGMLLSPDSMEEYVDLVEIDLECPDMDIPDTVTERARFLARLGMNPRGRLAYVHEGSEAQH